MSKLYKTRGGRILNLTDEQYQEFTNQYGKDAYTLATQEDITEYKMVIGDVRGLDVTNVYWPLWTDYKLHEGYGYTDYCFRNFVGYGRNIYQRTAKNAQCLILLHRGDSMHAQYHNNPGLRGKMALFTMYETTKFPEPWLNGMQLADLLIVPNHDNKLRLEQQGVKKPIVVCPLPYNPEHFPFKERSYNPGDTFKFLMYNAGNHRKGWKETAEAFLEEFGENEKVQLTLKTIFPLHKKINGVMMADPQFVPYMDKKNIKFVSETTEKKDLHKILHDHHCFVFPSKGEGWGYPPIEALSTGMPLIATNAHGHADFWTSGCYEVGYTMQPAEIAARPLEFLVGNKKVVLPSNQNGEQWRNSGDWWQPKLEDIKRQMRYVFENYQHCLAEAKLGSQEIQAKFSYKAVNPILSTIAKDLASGKYANIPQLTKTPVRRLYKAIILASKVDRHLVHRPVEILKKQDCEVIILADYKSPITIAKLKKEFGVEVWQHKLNDNFADHRNFAINQIDNGEWIIMIDGDEVVSDNFISALDNYLNANPAVEAVALARINTYGDELNIPAVDWSKPTGDQYPDFQTRVFKKTPLVKYTGVVHEQLTDFTVRDNTTDKDLTILHHKSYEKHNKSNQYYEVLQSMR